MLLNQICTSVHSVSLEKEDVRKKKQSSTSDLEDNKNLLLDGVSKGKTWPLGMLK